MLAVYHVCPEYLMFAEHLMLAIYQVYAEYPVCAGSGHGLKTTRSVLTTLQPAQSGPFSQVLRRAWMPPPHWAVHRSQGPQPVQNMCGGHSKCSLQYLWWENQEEKEAVQGIWSHRPFHGLSLHRCWTHGHAPRGGALRVRSGGTVKGADVVLAMLWGHRQRNARDTTKKMLNSQCRMELPVQPIRGETNKTKPFK